MKVRLGQPSLFDEAPTPPLSAPGGQRALADEIMDQIVRDTRVLTEDVRYHVPSTEFFRERILAYRAWLAQVKTAV